MNMDCDKLNFVSATGCRSANGTPVFTRCTKRQSTLPEDNEKHREKLLERFAILDVSVAGVSILRSD
jgi:hypothetical protein